ncbi:efflux RND transporter periplasmic adaptor subunit [Shewanella schlegeliana]|uniref:Efflux RND transporter periplasmic adaptor subunit n=1 Tax=Shewanella schlegeliana TaxID=190308 RepID=A0ABS1T095_9GAMM|nr:efflux RND transporter periplasmic adaptor subunit [Shewanella schlegeliana]MBL4914204.1 efflux RND transporter periplasmic adaptor subunit [Shewanella schlegeliana]MCL1111402.1 efflux RND transporter periplasmic adaptor subunit [Shewanella schlegeliana]GIU33885.1 MexE family multidrug efflux RND transporter periplasmic adaptor subunit [Shewanella schlegeliana]
MAGSVSNIKLWVLILSAAVISGCGDAPAPQQAVLPSVIVNTAHKEMITPKSEFVGRTRASEDVVIKPQIQGQLLKRSYVEGDDISAGDLLFEIDPSTYEAELAQHQAVLKQAKASRDVAVMNWERGRRLLPDGMISAQDMDELTSRKLTTAAGVVQAEAAVEAAKLQLSYTKVFAPISGRVSQSEVSLGDIITPQTEMANIVQLQPMWVNFQIAEKALITAQQQFSKAKEKEIKIEDLVMRLRLPNGTMFDEVGHIDFIGNRVDAATGTLPVRATFKNANSLMLPGLFVTLVVESPITENALLIPQAAVQEDQQGRFVMVVNEQDEVQKRVVELGERFGVEWRVLSGLEDGDRIVVEGLQKIRPGIKVNPVEQEVVPFKEDEKS